MHTRELLLPPSQFTPRLLFPTLSSVSVSDDTGPETQGEPAGDTQTSGVYWQSLSEDCLEGLNEDRLDKWVFSAYLLCIQKKKKKDLDWGQLELVS